MLCWRSGLTHCPLKATFTGSNPVQSTIKKQPDWYNVSVCFFMGSNPAVTHFRAKIAPKVGFLADFSWCFFRFAKFCSDERVTIGDERWRKVTIAFWCLHERYKFYTKAHERPRLLHERPRLSCKAINNLVEFLFIQWI